jgi:hypothetical protein
MKKALFIFILITRALYLSAQDKDDLLDPVIKTIREADASALAAYFNVTIELKLPDHENSFSASQGEMIMKDFFKKFPPESLTIIQKGNTDANSRFAICNYRSANLQYQVYIYMKKENDKFLIQKLKFEDKK